MINFSIYIKLPIMPFFFQWRRLYLYDSFSVTIFIFFFKLKRNHSYLNRELIKILPFINSI